MEDTPVTIPVVPLWKRILFAVAGCLLILAGLIGTMLPVIPGVVLIAAGVALLMRASPRIDVWMRIHWRRAAGRVSAWRNRRQQRAGSPR